MKMKKSKERIEAFLLLLREDRFAYFEPCNVDEDLIESKGNVIPLLETQQYLFPDGVKLYVSGIEKEAFIESGILSKLKKTVILKNMFDDEDEKTKTKNMIISQLPLIILTFLVVVGWVITIVLN